MLEHLNKYFDKFIKQYHPYEDKEFYQILIKFVQENFLVDSYDEIPANFKTLFEKHTLIPDIYDIILESLGYDKKLLSELSFNQKKTLLKSFPNYHRDKGDLKSLTTICKIFNEPINLYELYIDYRVSTGLFDWYFIPKPISILKTTDVDSITPLNYDEIYNATPSYFVNKASLINKYRDKAIKLPLKSNLIMLEVSSVTQSDELSNLRFTTTLFHFRDLEIPIYIGQNPYIISLMGLYQLWNYMLILFYNQVDSFETNKPTIMFNLDGDSFHYTLDVTQPNNFQAVEAEYDALFAAGEISDFYTDKFKTVFLDYIAPNVVTIDTIRRNLAFSIDINILQHIDQLLEIPSVEMVSSILVDLRNSLINFMNNVNEDPLFTQYSPELLNVFELALINPVNTATYKLIDFFKPYHTQLISKFKYGVSYKSKFTNALVQQSVKFVTHQFEASALVISTDHWFSEKVDGICDVNDTTEIKVADDVANRFEDPWELLIYWPDTYSRYPDNSVSKKVISKYWTDVAGSIPAHWTLVLESAYTGEQGIYDHCYIRYHN